MEQQAEPAPPATQVRPLVARPLSNRGVWVFALLAIFGASALFAALEARRAARTEAALTPAQVPGEARIEPPAPLVIPEPATQAVSPLAFRAPAPAAALASQLPLAAPIRSVRSAGSAYGAAPAAPYYSPVTPLPAQSGPALVYQAPAPQVPVAPEPTSKGELRVSAGHLANPATTIPQGAVVQAVLETALDSTRAGPARALVSRDVRGFDGSHVLIQRGSRLYGEYKADLSSGQNRAMIQWTRLIRPDGVVIALDSPSADPLGRAGVEGKVNSHFFARFGGALLQTTLDLGVNLATRDISRGTVILGLPGSTQALGPQVAPENVRPTLKVKQGSPVSVFVARDLDFTEVER